jgi:hypothetical protein
MPTILADIPEWVIYSLSAHACILSISYLLLFVFNFFSHTGDVPHVALVSSGSTYLIKEILDADMEANYVPMLTTQILWKLSN